MKHSIDCLPCLLQQAVRTAKKYLPDEADQIRLVKETMGIIADLDNNVSAPYIAYKIQAVLTRALNNPDPFWISKNYYNQEMLKLENEMIDLCRSYEKPFIAGLKLAAAGNIIDFGPGYDLSKNKVLDCIRETLEKDYSKDTMRSLQSALEEAKTLLYLGDNAGEIVFDKIFIAIIKEYYPGLKIYFATRGEPVLNDVTEEDAYMVGMDKMAKIINNGTGIPGTVLEYCSPYFQQIFAEADVVISKGQGNFESLYKNGKEQLYYIFLCKCRFFMESLGAKQHDLILLKE